MGVDGPLLGELGWFGEVDEEEDMFVVILSKAKSEIFFVCFVPSTCTLCLHGVGFLSFLFL